MNTPNIRFKGYTDAWEQRKLGEVAGVYDGVHQTPDYQDNGIMFLSVENISTLKSEKFISEEAFERDYKIYPEQGDILMTRIGDVGTPNVVETDEKLAYYVSLALLKPNGIDSHFLCNAIQSTSFQNGLRERTLVTAIPMKINKDEIGKVDLSLPSSIEEQKQIGSYFKNLDNLIALQQRKCDDLQEVKKYMLQKLFPQNGAKAPEIRFAGFTGEWAQRKLGDFFSERSERANGDEELLSVTIANGVIRQIDSDKRNTASEDKSNYKVVKKGDVPYNSMRMWQGAVGTSAYDGIVSPAYTVLTPKINANGKFFMELFKKESTLEIFKRWSQGLTSDTWNLKFPVLSTIVFAAPSIEEQDKIADYFTRIDNLIDLQQRKCDDLQEVKRYMLQNMFPQGK